MPPSPWLSSGALGAFVAASLLGAVALRADEPTPPAPETPLASTGTVEGRVRFTGEVPPAPPPAHAHHDPSVCADVTDDSLRVGDDHGLANAVVVVQGIAGDPAGGAGDTATLDQQGCAFVPHVQSVRLGTTLKITSHDPVLHNVHAFLGKRTAFNLAIPVAGKVVDRTLGEPGILRVRCDSGHTWMSAYVAVVPHRFHATTGADGSFAIAGLPPGEYRLRAWHERLGAVEQKVVVTAGETATTSLTFKELESATAPPEVAAEDRALRDAVDLARTELARQDKLRRDELRDLLRREGQPLYAKFCATCHGTHGDGRGPSARFLSTPPRDFTRGTFKFRMTPAGSPPTRADLVRTIRAGVRGTQMPSWKGKLRRSQIETLAAYVTTLSDVFWTGDPPAAELVIPPEPTYDLASVARGRELFAKMQCATCHGPGGAGDGPAAPMLRDDWNRPIKPANFTRGLFKGGCCGAVVYRAISTGLGGTPMPSFAGAMTEAERWDLVHYVLSLGAEQPALRYLTDPVGRMTPP